MSKRWESNGDNYHPLEDDLEGARVRLGYGSHGQHVIGTLRSVRANTRGNTTIAVVGRRHNSAGVIGGKVEVPLWTLRKHPFTLEPVARHRLTPARPEPISTQEGTK